MLRERKDELGGWARLTAAHGPNTSIRPSQHTTLVVLAGCAIWLAALGWVDRATGYEFSKQQFLRRLDDTNTNPELGKLEQDIVETSNKLGIGPMGFGGKTTLLGTKIGVLNRLPASYFVSISYMCWAYRRQGVTLDATGQIQKWLY